MLVPDGSKSAPNEIVLPPAGRNFCHERPSSTRDAPTPVQAPCSGADDARS